MILSKSTLRGLALAAVLLTLGQLAAGCASASVAEAKSSVARETAPNVPPADLADLVKGRQAFALGLVHQLSGGDTNVIFSPFSISEALLMAYAGARGQTAAQMATALHFTLPDDRLHPAANALDQQLASRARSDDPNKPYFDLNVANSLWGQKDFSFAPGFLDLLARNYGAGIRLVDFKTQPETARQAINGWVGDQTHGKIPELFAPGTISPDARLVLANAIYFHGAWADPFDKALTQDAPFTRLDGSMVSVPMMTAERHGDRYAKGDGWQAVSLDYKGGDDRLAMLVVLPDAGRFKDAEAGLDADQLAGILAGLQPSPMTLWLPRFKFESGFTLNDTLIAMGMPDAFSADKADFSGMPADGSRSLFIGLVVHKATVAVDEEGATAAAATGIGMMTAAAIAPPEIQVKVDRPFIFAIYDRTTGELLFLGRVLDPSK